MDDYETKETEEEVEDITCETQMHFPKENKKWPQSIDIKQAILEKIEEIVLTCKDSTTSEVEATS